MEEMLFIEGENRLLKIWLIFLFSSGSFFVPSLFDAYNLPKITLLRGTLVGC